MPALAEDAALETIATLPEPPGNIAVSPEGRIFFTVHPESRPTGDKLYELRNGSQVPYPDETFQENFKTPLGLYISRNRLWLIDHGGNGFKKPRLFAFDLASNQAVLNHEFSRATGQVGSYFNDLRVSPDGNTVYIADISFLRKKPAIVVYDLEKDKAWRVLEKDKSVVGGSRTPQNKGKKLSFYGGLVKLKLGIDGIALDKRGEWLYYAPMSQKNVYRVRTEDLKNTGLSEKELSAKVELVGKKPLCDGIEIDEQDNLYITDIENGSIFKLDTLKNLSPLVSSPNIRWPDGLSYANGYLYITDSALGNYALGSKKKVENASPFYIYRVKTA